MLNAYYFNFKRGYISPEGTAKFNHRYVGIPAPKLYAPVILGSSYSPYDLQEHTKALLGASYSPYDLQEHRKALLGASYSPYDLQEHRKAVFGLSYDSLDPFFQEDIDEI